jgi:hypothetical protein
MAGGSSSSWPISGRRRWRSRRSAASTNSSPSSARSTAYQPAIDWQHVNGKAGRSSTISKNGCAPNAPGCRARRNRQGDRLHADALDRLHPFPRRRPRLPDQQGGGTSPTQRRGRICKPSRVGLRAAVIAPSGSAVRQSRAFCYAGRDVIGVEGLQGVGKPPLRSALGTFRLLSFYR